MRAGRVEARAAKIREARRRKVKMRARLSVVDSVNDSDNKLQHAFTRGRSTMSALAYMATFHKNGLMD